MLIQSLSSNCQVLNSNRNTRFLNDIEQIDMHPYAKDDTLDQGIPGFLEFPPIFQAANSLGHCLALL
jgi:hypothetical protein